MLENLNIVEEETCLFIENKSENKRIIFWQKNIFKVTSAMLGTFFLLIPLVHFKLIENDSFINLAQIFVLLGASSFIADLVLRFIPVTQNSVSTLEIDDGFIVVKYFFNSQTDPSTHAFEIENIKHIYINQEVKELVSKKGELETRYFYELGL
jgi:hypothetical protein